MSAGLLMFGCATTVGATIIETFSSWNGSTYITPLGEPNTASIGQTFRLNAGDDNVLDSITVYVWNTIFSWNTFSADGGKCF